MKRPRRIREKKVLALAEPHTPRPAQISCIEMTGFVQPDGNLLIGTNATTLTTHWPEKLYTLGREWTLSDVRAHLDGTGQEWARYK